MDEDVATAVVADKADADADAVAVVWAVGEALCPRLSRFAPPPPRQDRLLIRPTRIILSLVFSI